MLWQISWTRKIDSSWVLLFLNGKPVSKYSHLQFVLFASLTLYAISKVVINVTYLFFHTYW